MQQKNDEKFSQRFDDTYRTILVIVSILFAFIFTLGKETTSAGNLVLFLIYFILSLSLWSFSHLFLNEQYKPKIVGWFFLIYVISLSLFRLFFKSLALGFQSWYIGIPLNAFIIFFSVIASYFVWKKFGYNSQQFKWTMMSAILIIVVVYLIVKCFTSIDWLFLAPP